MDNSTNFDSSIYDTQAGPMAVSSGDSGEFALMLGFLGIAGLVMYVVFAIFMGMIFKKADVPAWKAWVPIYNQWVFLELGGQKGWWVLLSLIPFVNLITVYVTLVFMCIAAYRIGLNFGKEAWFVVLYILAGPIWLIWLAVDKTAVWQPGNANAAPEISTQPAIQSPENVAPQPQNPYGTVDTPQPPVTPVQYTPNDDPNNNQQQQPPTTM